MRRSSQTLQTVAFLAALGLSAPAWANGSASSTFSDPAADEGVTTITSVSNGDGTHIVTQTGPDGTVISQVQTSTDPQTGIRTTVELDKDGNKTITITNARGEEISQTKVAAKPASETDTASAHDWSDTFDAWIDNGGPSETGGTESAAQQSDEPGAREPSDLALAEQVLADLETEMKDLKREIDALRQQHRDLLDEAARTRDESKFRDLVKRAQEVFDKLEAAEDEYIHRQTELAETPAPQGDGIGPFPGLPKNSALTSEIDRLTTLRAELIDRAEHAPLDDEEGYQDLMEQAAAVDQQLDQLEAEFERQEQEKKDEGDQRKLDRQQRRTQIGSLHRTQLQHVVRNSVQNSIRSQQVTAQARSAALPKPPRSITLTVPSNRF